MASVGRGSRRRNGSRFALKRPQPNGNPTFWGAPQRPLATDLGVRCGGQCGRPSRGSSGLHLGRAERDVFFYATSAGAGSRHPQPPSTAPAGGRARPAARPCPALSSTRTARTCDGRPDTAAPPPARRTQTAASRAPGPGTPACCSRPARPGSLPAPCRADPGPAGRRGNGRLRHRGWQWRRPERRRRHRLRCGSLRHDREDSDRPA